MLKFLSFKDTWTASSCGHLKILLDDEVVVKTSGWFLPSRGFSGNSKEVLFWCVWGRG